MKKIFGVLIGLSFIFIPQLGFGQCYQDGYSVCLPTGCSSNQSPIWNTSTKKWTCGTSGVGLISNTAYDATSWDGVTTIGPSKNATRDYLETRIPAGTDGTYGVIVPNNTTRTPAASTDELYPEANVWKVNQNGTESSICIGPTAGQVTITGPTAATSYVIPDRTGQFALINNTFTHDFGGAAVTKNLTAAESSAAFITTSNANGGVILTVTPALPGKMYLVYNNTGQVLTFQVAGQTGGTIATGKYALYAGTATDVIEIFEQP